MLEVLATVSMTGLDNLYLLSKTIFRTDLCHAVSGNVPICFLSASDQLYQHASQLCLSMCLSCDIHSSVVIIISQLVVLSITVG